MKRIILFFIAAGWIIPPIFSQVIIDQSDMPSPGDTLRVSVTGFVPAGYAKTAMDTAWNYSALQALSQRLDSYVNVAATPPLYQLVFVLGAGANLAAPRDAAPVPGIPVTQGFTFYKNSSTSFSDLGSAYTIQEIPLPAKYDVPDKQYQFPMTPGLTWSSTSSFAISVPDMLTYNTRRTRSSVVDGWGTLTIPFGTFQTLRVKSILAMHDSIFIDSLGSGFSFDRDIIEYKWLARGEGIPLLQITEEENMVTATYRDFYRMTANPLTVTLGPDTAVFKGTVLTLHATVSGGTPPYQILWNTSDIGNAITDTINEVKTYIVFAVDALQNTGSAQKVVSIRYPSGVKEQTSAGLDVYPNPSQGSFRFSLPGISASAGMQVISPLGKVVRTLHVYPAEGDVTADLSGLPDGLYFILIAAPHKIYSTRLLIIK